MFTKIVFYRFHCTSAYKFLCFVILLCNYSYAVAQQNTILTDTIKKPTKDTLIEKISPDALDTKVTYNAEDSIIFDMEIQKAYLYSNAEILYEDITLKAAYIEISFQKNELHARGIIDSTGKEIGTPVFTEKQQSFNSKILNYNFKSKKGLIKDVITKEGENYLHGEVVKKLPNNEINIKRGLFTTCSDPHPHFEFKFLKAKVIPNEKIVTGPVYLVVEDVPTPLALPFGLFPNKKGQQNGFLLPTYGESVNRGFYLENGGYYFGINRYMDLELRGDIYTRGSWAAKVNTNYHKKYKFSGNLNANYSTIVVGTKGLSDYSKNKAFFVRWNHSQDPKARPNSRFSASVNAGSTKYNTYNPSSFNDLLTNTFRSSVSYQTTIASNYNFAANLEHSQNNQTGIVDLKLPEISFSVNRFYPFRRAMQVGSLRWYENIGVSYQMNATNNVQTIDTLLFRSSTLDKLQNGVRHPIQVSSPLKIMKYFTLTNSLNYTERWYLKHINRSWIDEVTVIGNDTLPVGLHTDTIDGFITNRDFNIQSSLNTRLYGIIQFKKGYIRAIRHVLTPSLNFTYLPDFSREFWGYYKTYQRYDSIQHKNIETKYSIFEGGIYGAPPPAQSGIFGISFANNLEMKVKNKKDSITGFKKIVLIENLTVGTNYDVAKDSLNWSNIQLSGRTVLFRNLNITYGSYWSMYQMDSLNRPINRFLWKDYHRLAWQNRYDWAFSLNYSVNSNQFQPKKEKTSSRASEEELQMIKSNIDSYIDFDMPWSFQISYDVTFLKNLNYLYFMQPAIYVYPTNLTNPGSVVQTLRFNGELSLTKKWKISATSGYDFKAKDFSLTSINIYRDLHCWEMRFNWIPFGYHRSYNFTLSVKAAALQDMKLTKKSDWRDRL